MAKTSPKQHKTVARVMHEFKEGDLESSSGEKVTDRKQAIAIGLSEAGASNRPPPRNAARVEPAAGAVRAKKT